MSLINQMLRDLEQRQGASHPANDDRLSTAQPVAKQSGHRRKPSAWQLSIVALVVISTAVAWWRLQPGPQPQVASAPGVTESTPAQEKPVVTAVETVTASVPQPMVVEPPAATPVIDQPEAEELSVAIPQPMPTIPTAAIAQKREPTPIERAQTLYQQALSDLQSGRTDAAIQQLQQSVRLNPGAPEPRTRLAQIFQQLKRNTAAQKLLSEGLQQNPGSAVWAMMLSRLQLDQNQTTPAAVTLERAQEAGATGIDLDLMLAALYQRGQRYRDAARLYQEVLAKDPQQGKAWLGLAMALDGLQQPADAVQAYRQALQIGGHTAQVDAYIRQRLTSLGT